MRLRKPKRLPLLLVRVSRTGQQFGRRQQQRAATAAQIQHLLVAAQPEIAEDARPHLELTDSRRPQVRAHEQHQPEREQAGHHGADEGIGHDGAYR